MNYNFEQTPENFSASVQIQEREERYGQGDTKRVIEFEIPEGAKLGFAFGDISESVTEAIMCPTTPWLQLGGGAVEWAIADAAGEEVFNKDAKTLMNSLIGIQKGESLEVQIEHARVIAELLGIQSSYDLEQIVQDSLQIVSQAEGEISVEFGASVPVKSGNLIRKGIDTIVLTNVTPNGRGMTSKDMALFTSNAVNAARLRGAKSLTVPAVGTGFAAAFGFGLSMPDSIRGYISGARAALQIAGENHGIERIDYNIYAHASQSNAASFAQDMLVDTIGGFDLVYPLE